MTGVRNYEYAIKCLNQLQTNYSVIQELQKQQLLLGKPARDPGLIPEMIEWIRRIGYTPSDFDQLHAIHVTGTKGKGSVCAFVQSILMQYANNGLKIGLYTSPHLKSVRERIMLQGANIPEKKFTKYFFEVYDRLQHTESSILEFPKQGPGMMPMYFRFLTLVSFHSFMQENVDHAIYEVGIGGEYDSTNVFVHPAACGVTSIGLDHTAILGKTLKEIAWNKSGIFKAGSPAFTLADQPAEVLDVLRERAVERKVSKFEAVQIHPDIKDRTLGLLGRFQEKNATLACYLAAERLGIPISHTEPLPVEFINGLEQATWPGRCQIIETERAKWFIDGAHTTESLDVAAEWLANSVDRSKPVTLVFNQQKRDNVEELLAGLFEDLRKRDIQPARVFFTTNQSFDKGFQDDMISHNVSEDDVRKLIVQHKLAEVWSKLDPKAEVYVVPSLEQAVRQAEGQVFATGSLLMVGGLLAVIE